MAILKIILVVILMFAMVMLLLGIGHFSSGQFDTDGTDIAKLKEEVDSKEEVISKRSVFHEFLSGARRHRQKVEGRE